MMTSKNDDFFGAGAGAKRRRKYDDFENDDLFGAGAKRR